MDLNDLRRRAGIVEDFDTASAGTPPAQSMSGNLMARLIDAGQGDSFADALAEAGKVMHHMTPQELWNRLVLSYLKARG